MPYRGIIKDVRKGRATLHENVVANRTRAPWQGGPGPGFTESGAPERYAGIRRGETTTHSIDKSTKAGAWAFKRLRTIQAKGEARRARKAARTT